MASVAKKLAATRDKAIEKNQWALAAAATAALANEDSLDARINVIGAIHEVGLLKNSAAPYLAWRRDQAEWCRRCLARLCQKGNDHDYWALAALLGTEIDKLRPLLAEAGLGLLGLHWSQMKDDRKTHVATLVHEVSDASLSGHGEHGQPTWSRVLELGWVAKTGELVDVSRWRAVILETSGAGKHGIHGAGWGTHFLRACSPYGCWRAAGEQFAVEAQWLIDPATTKLGKMKLASGGLSLKKR
jgi:hypothetical protein